ncbi:MAG: HAMP domain-containing histidine kinase [Actinobacteria bacterium]|nr:HAMP domain-containing histidine kinase [Actinomycetota bacterium]MBI3688858.1 HAMP domain-containing histidine kinase [Actinomycetota bacterium]
MTRAGGGDRATLRRIALRMVAQTVLSVAAIAAGLAGVAVLVVLRGQHAAADNLLGTTIARADDVADPPAGIWLVAETPTGRRATPGTPAGLPDRTALAEVAAGGPARTSEYRAAGREYRVRTERRGRVVVQAALDLRDSHAERARLVEALLLAGGLGVLLATGAGAWLGHRAVQPMATALAVQRRFVSDASHELRTPLTLLSTRAQLLRRRLLRGADPGALRSDLDGLVVDASRLAAILEDLLLAADPGAAAPTSAVNLVELAGQAVEAAAATAGEQAVAIGSEHDQPAVWALGTEGGLRRALTALVDNAVRHATGRVVVTVGSRGEHAVVEVLDDGPGIDPEMLPRLFDRFASTARPTRGARRYGLGLALVSEIATRHRGTVTAENAPGSGALFRLTVPLASRQLPPA